MNRKPISVMQLVPSLESGGVERGTLEVADELVRSGHRSIVVSAGGRLVERLLAGGSEHIISHIDRKSPLTLARIPKLRKLICEYRVDVLHVRSRIPAWIGWLAWKSLPKQQRPRFVTTVHGLYSVNRFSRIMTYGERVIAVSETIRNYVLENYPGVSPQSICLIPRGIDPQEFPYACSPSHEWLAKWNADHPSLSGKRLLTLAGRITRLKGHFDFLDLISALKSEGHQIHGLIVGDEDPRRKSYADAVRQSVRQLQLTDDITFLGHRSDIREIYAVSSIVLSLSTKPESFGRTTLEPLAMGVPVIGYDHGGVGEILRNVFPQGAVPLRDAGALREKASTFLQTDRVPVPEFDQFRLSDTLDQTISLYEQLTGRSSETSLHKAA
ncbi:MAG: glycosyltransferase family 4 protein [Planctomycetaceae bacterium]|nr:glycosyltransferase family 4 protein [Planctomycetaceae bacterium]